MTLPGGYVRYSQVRIISRKLLLDYGVRHASAVTPLRHWYRLTQQAVWTSLIDVRAVFPSADIVRVDSGRSVVIFNIGGNNHRLVAAIHYDRGILYTLRLMTHAQYNRNKWKEDL